MAEVKTRIVAIIIRQDKLLMLIGRGYKELWTPGGKVELNESDEDCLRRELKEEINADLIEAHFFREYSGESFYHPGQLTIQRVYILSVDGDFKAGAEIQDIVWLSKEDFINKKFNMIPITEQEIIPDLIKQGIF